MKIALIIERMDPLRGGRETSTAQIATGLARRGHEVTIICQCGRLVGSDITIRQTGRRGLLRVKRLGNFVADAQKIIAQENYDITHAMLPVPGANVYQPRGGTIPGQIAASARRWKLAGALRSGLFEPLNLPRRKLARYERQVITDSTVLSLPVSEMVCREFANFYDCPQNVRVVYNAVDIPAIDPGRWAQWRGRIRSRLGVHPDDPVFISVATNFPLKGIGETIRAFAEWRKLRAPKLNAHLIIVGREHVRKYERQASSRGVGRSVLFVPPTNEIFQWYAAADACILLSWYDPCSRTVLEATRLGIPSVTTVYNGAAEILAAGAGIVVSSPTDTRGILAALDDLGDREKRSQHHEACLRITESLSMDRHVDELLDAYAEVVRLR